MIELKKIVAVIALALMLGAASAREDSEDSEDDARVKKEYVEVNVSYIPKSNTVQEKLPVAPNLSPINLGTVSRALFREQNAVVLSDALPNVSGVNIQSGTGVHDYFVIRGFDSLSSGLVTTDGASEPEVTFYHLYNVEGVEVLKGPGGFLYGSDPLAGVVNMVRKQPVPTDFATFSASYGSHDTFEGTVDWNQSNSSGDVSFRFNALRLDTNGFRDDKQGQTSALNPSLAWRINERSTLNFNLEFVDSEYSPDSGLPLYNGGIPDVARESSYQSPFDFSEQSIYRFQVDYETRLNDSVTLRNKSYYRDLDWNTAGTQFNGVFPGFGGEPIVSRTLVALDDRQQFTGNQFEALIELGQNRIKHTILAGLETARRTDDFAIDFVPPEDPLSGTPGLPAISLINPVETATSYVPFPFLAGQTRATVIAPYVVDQIQLSQRFQLMLGARYDSIDYEDRVNAISRSDGELSPMAGVVFSPGVDLSVYANSAESFSPPSPRSIGVAEPEKTDQLELGVRKAFMGGALKTTFAVYELQRDNIAVPDDNGVTQQIGDQRSRGFEFELAAEPAPRLRAFFSYAYNDAELTRFSERIATGPGPADFVVLDRSGNDPAFAPKHLVHFWISKSFVGGWGVGGGARYVGEQYIAEDNAFAIDDALILDGTVFYNFTNCKVKLSLKNITDTDYETRGFGSTSVIPANPFSVYAGFEYRL